VGIRWGLGMKTKIWFIYILDFALMSEIDYYRILGVEDIASMSEIQQAYKLLSLRYHPDKNTDRNTTRQFQMISEAYQVLGDYHRRREYDETQERFDEEDLSDSLSIFKNFNTHFERHFKDLMKMEMDFHLPDFTKEIEKEVQRFDNKKGKYYNYSNSSQTHKKGDYGTKSHSIQKQSHQTNPRPQLAYLTNNESGAGSPKYPIRGSMTSQSKQSRNRGKMNSLTLGQKISSRKKNGGGLDMNRYRRYT